MQRDRLAVTTPRPSWLILRSTSNTAVLDLVIGVRRHFLVADNHPIRPNITEDLLVPDHPLSTQLQHIDTMINTPPPHGILSHLSPEFPVHNMRYVSRADDLQGCGGLTRRRHLVDVQLARLLPSTKGGPRKQDGDMSWKCAFLENIERITIPQSLPLSVTVGRMLTHLPTIFQFPHWSRNDGDVHIHHVELLTSSPRNRMNDEIHRTWIPSMKSAIHAPGSQVHLQVPGNITRLALALSRESLILFEVGSTTSRKQRNGR
jgi:hypothetical protein